MFSLKSIKTFLYINTILISLSFIEYCSSFSTYTNFSLIIFRNYLLIDLLDISLNDKEYIDKEKRQKPTEYFYREFDMYVLSSSLIEALSFNVIDKYYLTSSDITINDFVYFIPTSFMFELIFDFFHYITHRLMHNNYIYQYLHKSHHKFKYPTSIITFYQHPIDLIITNIFPTFMTLFIINNFNEHKMTLFTFKMISTYLKFIEISGHTGKHFNGSSFPQFFWIPKLFCIKLTTEEHDLHHSINNCNYSKRFILWDKIFRTYKKSS